MDNQMTEQAKHWMDINDYSRLKNISISTIRRRIKSENVNSKMVDGKYFIEVSERDLNVTDTEGNEFRFRIENERLRNRMNKLQEELDDLKTLISVYENNNSQTISKLRTGNDSFESNEPPAIPS